MKPQIIVLGPGRPSFIDMDVQLLQQIAPTLFIDVLTLNFATLKTFVAAAWGAKVCFFWFGSFRHFPFLILARVLGCRVVMVAGGYDVEKMPEIAYGAFTQNWFSRLIRRLLFRSANAVLAVSNYTLKNAISNAWISPKRLHLAPLCCAPPADVELTPWTQRPAQIALLLSCNYDRFLCKGMDRINVLAKMLPEVPFKLAGRLDEKSLAALTADRPPNLELLGFLKFQGEEFGSLLNSSRVVLVPSRCESFGAALVDGALYGCLPVGFAMGALPETIGGFGRTVENGNLDKMASVLREVLALTNQDVEETKKRASERFSRTARKARLQEILGPYL